jgi:ubiquinone/menaquinone biosynthesis C-methylase UbiE
LDARIVGPQAGLVPMCPCNDDAQYRTSENLSRRADLFKQFGTGAWHAWVFDHLLAAGLPGEARVADIGGGPGWLWQQNAARIPLGWLVTHTDLSSGMVAEARANIARPGSTFDIVDAQHLPFADASLDAVVANHMLYHVPDRARAISEFARVLKPRGQLFAATNGEEHMAEIPVLIAAFNRLNGGVFPAWPKLGFTLESGKFELERYFTHVALHHAQRGVMRITEARPLVACIASLGSPDEATKTELLAYVEALIAGQRTVLIRTQSGIFVARK